MLFYIYFLIYNVYATYYTYPQTRYYNWDIREQEIAPENYGYKYITFNGKFPGPKIESYIGDSIIVDVNNYLDRNFSIHWHGMLQKDTIEMDGVPYITQDPIKPNESYRYHFHVTDQAGTWFYHAHTGLDSEHGIGPLIVKDDNNIYNDLISYDRRFEYDEELILMLSEMRFKDTNQMVYNLTHKPFVWVGNPDAILTNGRSFKNWPNHTVDYNLKYNEGYYVLKVKQNKRYRLRLIGALEVTSLAFMIPNHKLTLIEVDGTYIEPIELDHIELNAGQRYSVILETNQPIDNYLMCAKSLGSRDSVCDTGTSILHYYGAQDYNLINRIESKIIIKAPPLTRWENKLYTNKWYERGLVQHYYPVPKKINKNFYFQVAEAADTDQFFYFTMNGKQNIPRNTTLWNDIINGNFIPPSDNSIINIKQGDKVQIVFEHFAMKNNSTECIVHPWHLHGHSFYVVGYGKNHYNLKEEQKLNQRLNEDDKIPILRDTFTHYPGITELPQGKAFGFGLMMKTAFPVYQTFNKVKKNVDILKNPDDYVSCGWYAIRFIADNPGTWYMHCHITPHLLMGKYLIVNEQPKHRHY